jgi:two-component sensor histidine kinase
MRTLLLLLPLGLFACIALGQNVPADTARVMTLIEKGRYYVLKPGEVRSDLDSALDVARRAGDLSRRLNYARGIQQTALLNVNIAVETNQWPLTWTQYPLLDDTGRINFLGMQMRYRMGNHDSPTKEDLDSSGRWIDLLMPLWPLIHTAQNVMEAYQSLSYYNYMKGDKKRAFDLFTEGFQRLRSLKDLLQENQYLYYMAIWYHQDTTLTPPILKMLDQLAIDDTLHPAGISNVTRRVEPAGLNQPAGLSEPTGLNQPAGLVEPPELNEQQRWLVLNMGHIGLYYYLTKQVDAHIYIEKLSMQINQRLHQHVAFPWFYLTLLYSNQGRTKEALATALDGVRVSEGPDGPTDGLGYEAASLVYYVTGDFDKSLDYFYKALPLFQKDPSLIRRPGELFQRAIKILLQKSRPAEALRLLPVISSETSRANHMFYLDQEYIALTKGDCYYALGKIDSAERYYAEARRYLPPQFHPFTAYAYNSLAIFYTATRQYARARPLLDTLTDDRNRPLLSLSVLEKAWFLRYQADSAGHDYARAMEHLRRYQSLHDSLTNDTKNKQLAEMNVRYETEKKNQHITDLENQTALQTRLQQSTVRQDRIVRNSLIAGALLLAIFAAVLYNRYRSRLRLNRRLQKLYRRQQRLLGEKEWLLREIHHRVKNNLQIIISLLRLQSFQLKDEIAISAFEDIGARIHTISLVHKKLYQQGQNLSTINMRDYISELVEFLRQSIGPSQPIEFRQHIDEIFLDVTQCMPLGLILNEAITNSIKYAFPANHTAAHARSDTPQTIDPTGTQHSSDHADRSDTSHVADHTTAQAPHSSDPISTSHVADHPDTPHVANRIPDPSAHAPSPEITITLNEPAGAPIELTIADNGIGLPPGVDPSTTTSLGLQLIYNLTTQLEGSFTMTNDPGLTLHIRFPRIQPMAGSANAANKDLADAEDDDLAGTADDDPASAADSHLAADTDRHPAAARTSGSDDDPAHRQ